MRKETYLPGGISWPKNTLFEYFAVDADRRAYFFCKEPHCSTVLDEWSRQLTDDEQPIFAAETGGIMAQNWQNTLIYRWEEAQTPIPDEHPIHRYIIYPKGGTPFTSNIIMELESPTIIFDILRNTYSRDFGQTWHEMESDHL